MGRLDCKIPSLIALKGLMRDADFFATISENEAADAMPILTAAGLETTPSGGAGLAAVIAATSEQRQMLGLDETSTILAFLSEGPES
jgi:diaminopropionate ammonia-lyase